MKIFTKQMIKNAIELAKKKEKLNGGDCFNAHGSTVYKLVEILETDDSTL